jgi:hypothetical protein
LQFRASKFMTTPIQRCSTPLTILRPSLAVLALASFAFGCSRSHHERETECVLPTTPAIASPSPALPATPAQTLAAVPTLAVAPIAPIPPAPRSSAPVPASSASRLVVKRFVVAADVRDREPLTISELPRDAERVYAFAELQNRGSQPEQVRITFERKGGRERVGHATLSIPASVPRHRTWATSRHVHAPGIWEAVLWSEGGVELGRTVFEVTETKSPATT